MQVLTIYAMSMPGMFLLICTLVFIAGLVTGWLLRTGIRQFNRSAGEECIERLEYLLS